MIEAVISGSRSEEAQFFAFTRRNEMILQTIAFFEVLLSEFHQILGQHAIVRLTLLHLFRLKFGISLS